MTNYTNPTREAFGVFAGMEREGPVAMLNLVQLREKAIYEDGRPESTKNVSGKEAYAEYGRTAGKVFARVGGTQIFLGVPELMLIGPEDEKWDIAFIAQYPSGAAFVEMVKDPEYQSIVFHRTAGVENSRLLRMKPLQAGAEFGASS